MGWQAQQTVSLTPDGSGDSLALRVNSPTDITVEYVLNDTDGKRHALPPPGTFKLADVALSATTKAAIGAYLTGTLGVSNPTDNQIAALAVIVIGGQRQDIRNHAAGLLPGFSFVP